MATPYQFKYQFLNEDGLWMYWDGGLQLSVQDKDLPESPKDWDEVVKSFTRGENSLGVFTRSSSPIAFHGYSKLILEQLYYIEGGVNFEAYCKLRILKRIDTFPNTWDYELDFEGELDFSTWADGGDSDNKFVNIAIEDKGLQLTIDTNSDVDYKFPIAIDSDKKELYHDGVELPVEYDFVSVYKYVDLGTASYILPVTTLQNENTGNPFAVRESSLGNLTDPDKIVQNNAQFIANYDINDGNIFASLHGGLFNSGATTLNFQLLIEIYRGGNFVTPVNAGSTIAYESPDIAPATLGGIDFSIDYPYDYQEGDYVMLLGAVRVTGGGGTQYTIDIDNNSSIILTGKFRLPSTTINCFTFYDWAKKMVEKVTEGTATMQSNLLAVNSASLDDLTFKWYNLLPRRLLVTSGLSVSNADKDEIKASWADLMQILNAEYGAGWGIEDNKVLIEEPQYFFNKTEITDIGEVKNLKITNGNSFIYNSVNAGYPDKDIRDKQGKDIVHSEITYTFPIKTRKNTKDLIAPCIADPYNIEKLRVLAIENDTTDTNSDNNVILFYTQGQPSIPSDNWILQRYTDVQNGGVFSPTTFYNQPLYPSEMMYRNNPYWQSILNAIPNSPNGSYKAVFQSGLRNTDAFVKLNTFTHVQSDDVRVHVITQPPAPTKLFIPSIYDFEHEPVNNLFELILNNKYGYITFTSQGKTYHGYVLNVDMVSSETDVYTFKLLGAAI